MARQITNHLKNVCDLEPLALAALKASGRLPIGQVRPLGNNLDKVLLYKKKFRRPAGPDKKLLLPK
jgi:hypothetical protein